MNENRTISTTLIMNINGYTNPLKQAGTETDRFTQRSTRGFEQQRQSIQRVGLAMAAAGALIVGGLAVSAKASIQFNSALTKSVTLIGISSEEMQKMGGIARGMGATGQGPLELANALFFVQSAGLRGETAMNALSSSARASSIGLGDTATIADLVTSAINAYGEENLSASLATDILTGTVREGKAEASELAGVMGRVLPIAAEMGISFDEVGAATAAMTRTGTDAATSTTQLRSIMTTILKPTQQAEEALGEFGLSSEGLRATIREDGLWSALMEMRTAFGDNEEAIGRVFPNVRALAGFLDLTGENAAANAEIFDNMTDTVGTTAEAFRTWSLTTEAAQQRFSAAMESAKISVGEQLEPTIRSVLDTGTGLLLLFEELPDEVKGATTTMATALGGLFSVGGAGALAIVGFSHVKDAASNLGLTLGSVARFAFHPLTLGAGALFGALALIANQKAEVARRAENLRAILGDQVDVLRDASQGWEQIEAKQRLALAEELLDEHGKLNDILKETPATIDDVVRARLGDVDAMTRLREIASEYTKVQEIQGQGATRRTGIGVELNKILDQEADVSAEAAEKQELLAGLTEETTEAAIQQQHEIEELALKMAELGSQFGITGEELEALQKHFRVTGDEALEVIGEMLEAWSEGLQGFGGSVEQYKELLADAEEKERERAQTVADSTEDATDSWEDHAKDVKLTIDDLIEKQNDQITAMQNWATNMAVLAAEGVDQGLLAELARAGPESADLVQILVDAPKDKRDEYVRNWDVTSQEGTDALAGRLIAAQPELERIGANNGQATVEKLVEYMIREGVNVEQAAEDLGINIDKKLREGEDREIPVQVTGVPEATERILEVRRALENFPKRITVAIDASGNVRAGVPGGASPALAHGGPIDGPGGPRDDIIPIWASNREYMMQASARMKYGDKAMAAVNAGIAKIILPWQDAYGGPMSLSQVNVHASAKDLKVADFDLLRNNVMNRMAESQSLGSGRVLPRGSYRIGRGSAAHGYGALDLPAPPGTPVASVAAGIVTRALRLGYSYGVHAFINHAGGRQSRYAHLSAMNVRVGQTVGRGQIIGRVGSTGNSTGPHLHYEDLINGVRRQPERLGIFDRGGVMKHGYGGMNFSGYDERVLDPKMTILFEAINRALTRLPRTAIGVDKAGQTSTAAGGQFVGNLYLDSGEFLGKVRGEVASSISGRDRENKREATRGRRRK